MAFPDSMLNRRDLLSRASAAALALPHLPAWLEQLALPPRGDRKTRHVVVVAFAGGVRRKDVIESPANVPNLMRIAKSGVSMSNVHCRNVGHYGAALSIFTGNVEVMGIRENERGLNPTLFEYLRKDAGLLAGDVWLSTANGTQGRLFAHSDHPAFGKAYAANVIDGDGLFNVEFQKVLAAFGRPRADGDADRALLDGLSQALDPTPAAAAGVAADPRQTRAVEKFILDELTGSTTQITGPGAGDAKAIRVGANILRVFRPKVLGITLQNADIAHGSYNGYVEVIRRNDAELGKLWDAVQKDPELANTTSIVVLPEFGRDKDLNERNGLDHGDNSDALTKVFLVAAGPDFGKDKVVKTDCDTHDVCPTVLSLFSKTPGKFVNGKVIQGLFA
jgi:hypothetical protein